MTFNSPHSPISMFLMNLSLKLFSLELHNLTGLNIRGQIIIYNPTNTYLKAHTSVTNVQ